MPATSENKIKEEVRKKNLRDFYVFVDEDPFRPDFYADLLFQAAGLGEGGTKDIFYGDELKAAEILDLVRSPSLWSPFRFILIRQGERIPAKQWEALIPLLKEPFDRCLLLVQCAKIDARFKFFQAFGKAGDRVALVKFDALTPGESAHWLQQFLRETGKEMDPPAKEMLVEWTLGSLSELKNAVSRAALFSGSEKLIRKEHVQAIGIKVAPEDVFRFTSRLLEGDRAGALSQLEVLLKQGEEPLALLGLLARQYRWLLSILTLRAEGKPDSAIASAAGIFPSAAKVLFPASRRLGSKKVIYGLEALAEADTGLKLSKVPKELLFANLVVKLTG